MTSARDYTAFGETIPVNEIGDISAYADVVRRLARNSSPEASDAWRRAYVQGLEEAYRRHDIGGVCALAIFAAARLDSSGRHEEAIEQLNFAIAMADQEPGAAVYLLSVKAVFESVLGAPGRAERDLRLAKQRLVPTVAIRFRLAYETHGAIVTCTSLKRVSTGKIAAPIPAAEREGFDWMSSALKCWLIPYLFARGECDEARPWIESLRVQAQTTGHRARLVDAEVFTTALGSVAHAIPPSSEGTEDDIPNSNAAWRLAVLELRGAIVRCDWQAAEGLTQRISSLAERVSPGFSDGVDGFKALIEAYREQAPQLDLLTPRHVGLVNIAAVLAGMEAVAIAGSQSAAARWLRWVTDEVPSLARISLEWPVAIDRPLGLLQVRAGDARTGASYLRRATQWANSNGYEVEAALAQTQLAEVLAHGDVRSTRRDREQLRERGWKRLNALGINPVPHAYVATQALALSRDSVVRPNLTPRETDVLAQLANGLTYRQTASHLGISWRTVQLHAYHAYDKLGVHGKLQAVTAARELGIL